MSFQESVQQDLLVNFRGEARVKIDRLSFPFARRRVRESKVVEIVRLYEKTGCLSLDPEFALPAITDHDHPVNSGAANDGIVRCLHGQHRVEAARRHLDEEAEWLVRYYSSNIREETRSHLIEGPHSIRNYTDGEIFLEFCAAKDSKERKRWSSRLSRSKERDLYRIYRYESLYSGLKRIADIEGFWHAFSLGSAEYILGRYDEEALHYLQLIDDQVGDILGSLRPALAGLLDEGTIKSIQLRVPRYSANDRSYLEESMDSGDLYPLVSDTAARKHLRKTLLEQERILSLESFFRDLGYLKECMKVMVQLVPSTVQAGGYKLRGNISERKNTIKKRFASCYHRASRVLCQVTEDAFITLDAKNGFEICYRQVVLCVMRYLSGLDQCRLRAGKSNRKPLIFERKPRLWFLLAELSIKIGFKSTLLSRILKDNNDDKIVKSLLTILRPDPVYEQHRGASLESLLLEEAEKCNVRQMHPPPFTSPETLPMEQRCGIPDLDSYRSSCPGLYLQLVEEQISHGVDVTPFYIRCDVFRCFFGHTETVAMARQQPSDQDDAGEFLTVQLDVDQELLRQGNQTSDVPHQCEEASSRGFEMVKILLEDGRTEECPYTEQAIEEVARTHRENKFKIPMFGYLSHPVDELFRELGKVAPKEIYLSKLM